MSTQEAYLSLHRPTANSALCLILFLSAGPANAAISPDWVPKWRADLAFARDSLPRSHPSFFHEVSREGYRAALDSLSARVPGLDHHEIVVGLARIVALVHDGHTRLTLPFDSAAGVFTGHTKTERPKVPGLEFRHYPIRLGLFADTLWVTRTDSAHRDLLGGRVIRLGSMQAGEAMAAVEPAIQRDNESQVRDLMPTWLVCPEILHACGVVADMERAAIVVEQAPGARVTATLTPVAPPESVRWLDARATGPLPLRDRYPERRHWFTTIPGSRAVYARYREVSDDPNESVADFADSLFAAIERSRADRLVLDLRGNVGGNGSLNRPLVQHLIRAERLWRAGGLWALIDRGTFSAAVMMTADLEMRTPTLLVGEMTGGHPNSYGDSRRVVLPNTGVTVRVSSLYWQLTSPQDPREGIAPHVPSAPRYGDWRANRDTALETALERGPASSLVGAWSGEIGYQFRRLPLRLDLSRKGTGWKGRVAIPDAGIEDVTLESIRVAGETLATRWTVDKETLRLEVRSAGKRAVGIIRFNGLDYPFVLERAATK